MNKYIDAEKLKAYIEKLLARANRRTDKEHLSHNSEMEKFGEDYWNGYGDFAYGLLGYVDSLQQEQPEKTCKTCGFYENNCPFIRGKLIPYPNKVCKDYIYSAIKEQEQPELPSNLDEAAEEEIERFCSDMLNVDIIWARMPLTKRFGLQMAKFGAEWMAGQFQKIEGDLVDWYETHDVEYCSGIRTHESFKVPSGFYIKKEERSQPFRGVESCNIAEDSLSLPR